MHVISNHHIQRQRSWSKTELECSGFHDSPDGVWALQRLHSRPFKKKSA